MLHQKNGSFFNFITMAVSMFKAVFLLFFTYFSIIQTSYSVEPKVISNITANVVNANLYIDDTGNNGFFEIPVNVSQKTSKKVYQKKSTGNIVLDGVTISYNVGGESDSMINVALNPVKLSNKPTNNEGNEDNEFPIEFKNEYGDIIKAKIRKNENNKLIFDQDGVGKLRLDIDISPKSPKSKRGVYKASYYIVIQH